MPELKKEHAVAGGAGILGLVALLIQQMFAMDARNAENWRKHAREDMALHERVAILESRIDFRHGNLDGEERDVATKAAVAEASKLAPILPIGQP